MGSHYVDILRQGIWASLTGGWFYDPQQAIFCNTAHFYLWLFLLNFPFILYLTLESTVILWTIYCSVIGVVFTLVKFTSYKLHNLFDTCEVIEEPSSKTVSQDKLDGNKNNNEPESGAAHPENIEMMAVHDRSSSVRENERANDHPSHTVKVITEDQSREDSSDKQCSPDHDTDQHDKSDKEKDDSDGSSKPNIPTYITTRADIEKTPDHFHRELSLNYKNPTHDIQFGEKSAVRRTKSDLEPSVFKVHSRERNERFSRYTRKSLPSAPKISSVGMITEQPLFETGNLRRPKHDKTSQSESDTIKDGMTLLKSNSDDDYRTRSQTSNVDFMCKFESMTDSPETSLSSQLGRDECDKQIQVNVSQSPNHTSPQCSPASSCSYISTGEVIPDNQSKVTSSWPGAIESCSRPSSGQTDSAEFLENILNSQQKKDQLSSKPSYEANKYLQCSDDCSSSSSHSQQSSVLGLDQLFCSDTDSLLSEGEVLNLSRHPSSVSSHSSTNEEKGVHHSKSEETVKHDDELPTCSSSSPNTYHDQNEIDVMRRKGAIPKNYHRKKRNANMFERESPQTEKVDSEDYERRLLKSILQSDSDVSIHEQIKQLKEIIDSRRERVEAKDTEKNTQENDSKKTEEKAATPEGLKPDENDQKCTTPTENCALLPVAFSGPGVRKRHRSHHRSRRSSPPIYAALSSMVTANHHLAACHEDTTEGAVHCFQDDGGNWFTYTFGGDSTGVALTMPDPQDFWFDSLKHRWANSSTSGSDSTAIMENTKDEKAEETEGLNFDLYSAVPGLFDRPTPTDNESYSSVNYSVKEEKNKQFYNFELFPKFFMKIRFDRLALLAMLDRNLSIFETIIAIVMAVLTGLLGALILSHGFYKDIFIFLFCFVMASCQYSLLKSVQPDAASPMHGYNHLIVFNRPFYFCVCCSLMLLLDYASNNVSKQTVHLYGLALFTQPSLILARDILEVFILCFPFLFTFGLLPQVNTFCIYIFEQIDMHVFGGNATTGLGASIHCILRSLLAVIPLYGLCYGALVNVNKEKCSDTNTSQHIVFSIFCAVLVPISYHLSRCASNPTFFWMLLKDIIWKKKETESNPDELIDPLPAKLKECVSERLQSDFLVFLFLMVFVFAIHVSTVFSSPILQPVLFDILCYLTASFGFLIHYVLPQMQKEMPWLCCSHPILQRKERNYFEVKEPAQVMWFERMCIWLQFIEKNIMYPAVFLSALTSSSAQIVCKFGLYFGSLIVVICGMKLLRFAFCDTPKQYIILVFTVFFFKYDYRYSSETFLIDYFFMSIVFCKFCDFHLKMKFILTYIAPWQITWGSAFHAFAQPFSVPHSAMLFLQTFISSVFSAPLNPVLGSAIFFTSYARPVKFWERDYNTKRVDHSNTRLSSQLERNPGADDNNLNSIFYEHLTRCLQHNLCGDLMLGRWGNVAQGDCFIMASDYLNALVHIVEMANGLVTFQLRGLEFRGTYCQQREVEAITEGVEDSSGFCCFDIGHLPHFLSLNAAFNQRWLAWEVVSSRYVLEGYSISDLSAASMFQVFDLRKVLITSYVKAIIYYTVRSPRLEEWLSNDTVYNALHSTTEDLDPTFNGHVDEDYDSCISGISRTSFCNIYYDWIQYCASRREKEICSDKDSFLVSLCFGLSLLGRRALGTASHNSGSSSVDFFLYGLHALFKGDFRITSTRDEWVFADMEMLRRVVAPAVRMSFKLHQEHFTCPDEYDEDHPLLYDAITSHEQNMVISHEADPAWRNAVLSNTPCLLALRHVFDEGSDEYKIITLNKRFLTFRVVKINRECVRGLWAGQQQELIFLRNRNPERGSIQNAKQALRNMINSSCDQPIGYPIYVSPLTTSFSSTHEQLRAISVVGGEFLLKNVGQFFKNVWTRIRKRCDASCVGESTSFHEEFTFNRSCSHITAASNLGTGSIRSTSIQVHQPDIPLQSYGNRSSLISSASSMGKPSSFVPLSVLISENAAVAASKEQKEVLSISNRDLPQKERAASFKINHKVMIKDPSQVYDLINYRRTDMQWPDENWQASGGKSGWGGWVPRKGMKGTVVHRWVPNHYNPVFRSHTDKVILLVHVVDRYVPIAETGVVNLGSEV